MQPTQENPRGEFAALLGKLRSPEQDVRIDACKTLGKMAVTGESYVIGPLIRCLKNPDDIVRFNACEALGNIGEPRALMPLINSTKDVDQWVRESACRALTTIGDARAIPPLLERLDDTFDKVRDAAFKSLVSLGVGRLANAIKNNNINLLIKIALEGDPRPIDKILELLRKNADDKQYQTDIKQKLLEIHKTFGKKINKLLCSEHFHRFAEFTDSNIKINMRQKLPYYACRKCQKTLYGKSGIIVVLAILDENREFDVSFDSNKYLVNYFSLNQLFDFDQVEVIKASNKAIEQFCLKVSKDPDPVRKANYKKVKCLVSPNSGINDTSKNILKSVFGNIVSPG